MEHFEMTTTRRRNRVLRDTVNYEGAEFQAFPDLSFSVPSRSVLSATQETVSEGHYFSNRRGNEDVGGEFFTAQLTYWDNCQRHKVWSNVPRNSYYYDGTLFPYISSGDSILNTLLPLSSSSTNELDAAGTTAISRVLPTNPVAGLATAFGELREGFPKVIGTDLFKKTGKPISSRAGSEYLNYQFGWAPMVSDFKKWLYAVQNADKIWKQFQRDAGRHVRRRYVFPQTTEVTLDDVVAGWPVMAGPTNSSLWQSGSSMYSDLYRHHEVKRQRWFSGAFIYYMDAEASTMKTWGKDMQRLEKLYGTNITPEVIWNLSPWSWAADWFANTGDVVHNISRFAQDGLVMPYGYMMETSVLKARYSMRNVALKGKVIPDLTQQFDRTIKVRRKATPFGFGLDFDSFSQFQLSIIAALGLSRRH
jgi:hypothetical protein